MTRSGGSCGTDQEGAETSEAIHSRRSVHPGAEERVSSGISRTVSMEAASFGLPILATNVGSLPDLIDNGINGVLTTKNTEEISLKLLGLIKDSKERRRMGKNSIEKSNMEFKVEVFQKKQKSIYRKIIKK